MIALLFSERPRVPARCGVCGEAPELELRDGMLVCQQCVATSDKEIGGRVVFESLDLLPNGVEPGTSLTFERPITFVPTHLCVAKDSCPDFTIERVSVDGLPALATLEVRCVGPSPARFRAALVEARDW